MKDLSLFGTEAFPLHPSGLRGLIICPWKVTLMFLEEPEDVGGQAGDTGSAMHKAIAAFHGGKGVAESLAAMNEGVAKYPQADLFDAAAMFLAYTGDSRQVNATVVLCEEPISFSIAAAEDDPTGAPIQIVGTLDQVRRDEYGRLKLWDAKSSKKEGNLLRRMYQFQIAAYAIGATIRLGESVDPGGIILTRKYKAPYSEAPVMWPYYFTLADTAHILEPVRRRVAEIRRGILYHVPNDDCNWCHQRTEDVCRPKLIQLRSALAEASK